MKMKQAMTGVFSAIGFCLLMTTVCFAGGMNANEAGVYSAASGTFEYNGRTYQASPEYLAQLQAYLCRDDIDLTADQASAAISEMYSNIERGVQEGYIQPTDGAAPPADTETGEEPNNGAVDPQVPESPDDNGKQPSEKDKTPPQQRPEDDQTKAEDGQETKNEQNSSSYTDRIKDGSVVTSNGTTYGGLSETQQKEMEDTLASRVPKEDADAEIQYNKADHTISFRAKDGTVYTLPTDINTKMFSGWIRILQIIAVLSCLIAVVSGILLGVFGCFKFQKKKPSYSQHKYRRQIRKVTGILLTIVFAVDILGFCGGLWMQLSYFDENKVINALSDSGYYHEAYNSMMDDVHVLMQVSGCMENTCDDVLTYEKFMFATKNQIQLALQGKSSSATFEDIKADVEEAVADVEYFTQNSREKLGAAVLVVYQNAVKNVIGEVAYTLRDVFCKALKTTAILTAVSAVFALLFMILSENYQHRGIKKLADACLLSGIVTMILSIWMRTGKPYASIYISPDYLYLFAAYLVEHSIKVLFIISGVAIGIGILFQFAAYGMKKKSER